MLRILLFLRLTWANTALSLGWQNIPGPSGSLAEFTDQHPQIERIFNFHAGQWRVWDRKNLFHLRALPRLEALQTTEAYWVYAGAATKLSTRGEKGDIKVSFTLPWHLKGQVSLKYSLNDGRHFHQATDLSGTLNIDSPGTYHLIWHSTTDVRRNTVKARIELVLETGEGDYSTISEPFSLQNFSGTNHAQGPNITNVIPADQQSGVLRSAPIRVSWDQPISADSLMDSVFLFCNSQKIALNMDSADTVTTLRPVFQYPLESNCELTLLEGIESQSGAPLQENFHSKFSVEAFDTRRPPPLPEVPTRDWNAEKVRQVLHVFAFGGPANDDEINRWASMRPLNATAEILSRQPINPRLRPSDGHFTIPKEFNPLSLRDLSRFFSSEHPQNPITATARHSYGLEDWNAAANVWYAAALAPLLNPFLHWLGLMETNYHMAVNRNVGVGRAQLLDYYDRILAGHHQNRDYDQIMADAAVSAAVAVQYNHRKNEFEDGLFRGNEDFAREFHQLFFGILGKDPTACLNAPSAPQYQTFASEQCSRYHEDISIRNTARALTGMPVSGNFNLNYTLTFDSNHHHHADLEILGTSIRGSSASEKIHHLAKIAFEHPESRQNLGINLIRMMVDDSLDSQSESTLRTAWQEMQDPDLIRFLQSYAASPLFHSAKRVHYFNSFERVLRYFNLTLIGDLNRLDRLQAMSWMLRDEGVSVFEPTHDVFGGQTGLEAASSGAILRNQHDWVVRNTWTTNKTRGTYNQKEWFRDFSKIIPRDAQGEYSVIHVAEWLWNTLIADGLKNFDCVQRAQVYALLNRGEDFARSVNPQNPEAFYSAKDIRSVSHPAHQTYLDLSRGTLTRMGNTDLPFECEGHCKREEQIYDNRNIGLAINYIVMTPFFMGMEGLQ